MKELETEVDDSNIASTSEFSKSFNVVNNTDRPIYLYGREGYVATIASTPNYKVPSGIYFKTTIRSKGPVKTDATSNLVENCLEYSAYESERRSRNILESFTRIREELLDGSSTGFYYLIEHDVVLSFQKPNNAKEHPLSEGGLIDSLCEVKRKKENKDTLDVTISIVDNEGVFGNRFINIGGGVFRIPASKDGRRRNGIYISRSHEITVNGDVVPIEPEFFKFDDVTNEKFPFKLFGNYEDAKSYDEETAQRKELARTKIEHEVLKHKLDERAMIRKDTSDGWKMIPALVVGAAALLKLFF